MLVHAPPSTICNERFHWRQVQSKRLIYLSTLGWTVIHKDGVIMNDNEIENLVLAYESAKAAVQNIEKKNTYPIYPDPITKFMRTLQLAPWAAYDYQPTETQGIFENIEAASLIEVKRALTAVARSERFSEGAWAALLEEKKLDPVIARLQVLSNK